MSYWIFKGVLIGLFLIVWVGPLFFALLSLATKWGKKSAFAFSFGAISSDIICIILIYHRLLFIQSFLSEKIQMAMLILGGVIFLFFGWYLFANPILKKESLVQKKRLSPFFQNFVFFLQGFLLNALNPSVVIFWLTIIGSLFHHHGASFTSRSVYVFFSSLLATFFLGEVLKISFASRLSRKITPGFLKRLHKVLGIVLFLFGVGMIVKALF